MMVGREVIFESIRKEQTPGTVLFQLDGINFTDADNRPRLTDINLQVHAGEIVGIAGVEGNGQHELVNVIMGLLEPEAGKVIDVSLHSQVIRRTLV